MKENKITQKDLDKKKKRNKVLKTVAVCSLWTVLLVAFAGMIGLQIKSCVKKRDKQQENHIVERLNINPLMDNNNNRYLYNKYDFVGSYDYFSALLYDIGTNNHVNHKVDDAYYREENGSQSVLIDTYYDITRTYDNGVDNIEVEIGTYHGVNTTPLYRFAVRDNQTSEVLYTNNHYVMVYNPQIELVEDLDQYIDMTDEYLSAPIGAWLYANSTLLDFNNGYDFVFAEQINRFAPLLKSNMFPFRYNESQYVGVYNIFNGLFLDSNGNKYTKMRVKYVQALGDYFESSTGVSTEGTTPGAAFDGLYYVDINGHEIKVNQNLNYSIGGHTVWTTQSQWINTTYRYIKVVTGSVPVSSLPCSNMDIYELLHLFNENNMTAPPTTPGTNGENDGLLGVFGLFGMVFSSMAGFLGVYVIPGVTLGTLIFIPFMLIILSFIIWLFKR